MTADKPEPQSAAPPADERPEPQPEVWVFGGTHLRYKGDKPYAKMHAWIPLPANPDWPAPLLFPAIGSYAVGSEYVTQVIRGDDDVTLVGQPKYLGRHDDDQLRAFVETHHRTAETTYRLAAQERADKRDSPLEKALQPLIKLSAGLPPNQRDAFAAYVIRHLTKVW